MPETNNPLGTMLAQATQTMKSQWQQLVTIAFALSRDRGDVGQVSHTLARASGTSEDSIKRKIIAIQYAQSRGHSEEVVVKMGQTRVLSEYGKSKKQEKYEQMVNLTFKVPGSVRETVLVEFDRVKRILGISTSEQMFDFIVSQLRASTDDELRHAAGDLKHEVATKEAGESAP